MSVARTRPRTKAPPPEERPVAPYERAPERRRQELLESALIEFSTKGYGGARMDAIVERTNSNKAMAYHYFGSKEGLYLAVLEEVYRGIRAREAEIDFAVLEPCAAITRLIQFTFDYYLENPGFVRMINNENLHGAVYLRRLKSIAATNSSIIRALEEIVTRGVKAGLFRAGIDPTDLYISISALGFTYVANQHTLGLVFNRNLLEARAIKKRRASMVDMILRYLAA